MQDFNFEKKEKKEDIREWEEKQRNGSDWSS